MGLVQYNIQYHHVLAKKVAFPFFLFIYELFVSYSLCKQCPLPYRNASSVLSNEVEEGYLPNFVVKEIKKKKISMVRSSSYAWKFSKSKNISMFPDDFQLSLLELAQRSVAYVSLCSILLVRVCHFLVSRSLNILLYQKVPCFET